MPACLLAATRVLVLAGWCASAAAAGASAASFEPEGPVERQYAAAGPWAVDTRPAAACCDSAGFAYDLWLPQNLGRGGVLHPVITWGNGTGAPPSAYASLLSHLASWGFVVIASRQPMAGSGRELRDAVAWLQAENQRSGSPFFHRLAMDRVGAMGHSQGAMGAMNAMRDSGGRIRSTVAIAVPAQSFCPAMGVCTDPARYSAGSLFLVNGSQDLNVSPSTQHAQAAGLQSNLAYYLALPGHLPKAWGTLLGVGHSDVMGQPACSGGDPACITGVWGFLGYPTAWMMDQLQGNATAHAVFATPQGEFVRATGHWRNQHSSITR